MAMSRQAKESAVQTLEELLSRAKGGVAIGFQGLNVATVNEVRGKLREAGAEYRVVKNTLMKRALEGSPVSSLGDAFVGPTALVLKFDDNLSELGKALEELDKKIEKLVVKAVFIDTDVLTSADAIKTMASLPSLPEVQSQLLGLLNTPAVQLVSLLNEPAKKLLATTNEPARLVSAVLNAYVHKDAA